MRDLLTSASRSSRSCPCSRNWLSVSCPSVRWGRAFTGKIDFEVLACVGGNGGRLLASWCPRSSGRATYVRLEGSGRRGGTHRGREVLVHPGLPRGLIACDDRGGAIAIQVAAH